MSFLTDLFEGKTGNLGHDLSNPLDDAATDFNKQPSWLKDVEIAAPLAIGTVLTAGADLPALAGAGGLFGAADTAAVGADAGATALGFAGDVGAGVGASAGSDALGALDTAIGATGGALRGDALSLAAPAGDIAAAPAGIGAAWPASLDLGAGTAADVGGTAGAPLSLTGATTAAGAAAPAASGSGGILSAIGGGIKAAAPFVGAAGVAGS